MAHHTEQVGFPPVPISPGMRVRLRAIGPTTGDPVTGVIATEWAIYGRDRSAEPMAEVIPPWVPGAAEGGEV